jgi:hypothetical protein
MESSIWLAWSSLSALSFRFSAFASRGANVRPGKQHRGSALKKMSCNEDVAIEELTLFARDAP